MLITIPENPIIIRVANLQQNGVGIAAQFVHCTGHEAKENSRIGPCVLIYLTVKYHVLLPDGSAGERLVAKGITEFADELSADNDSTVDVNTGSLAEIRNPLVYPDRQVWLADMEADPRQMVLQGLFFRDHVRDNQPVVIGKMIRDNIYAADKLLKRWG